MSRRKAEACLLDLVRITTTKTTTSADGIVDEATVESVTFAVDLGVVRITDGHEMRPQASNPSLSNFGQGQNECNTEEKEGDAVKECDPEVATAVLFFFLTWQKVGV